MQPKPSHSVSSIEIEVMETPKKKVPSCKVPHSMSKAELRQKYELELAEELERQIKHPHTPPANLMEESEPSKSNILSFTLGSKFGI